MQKVTILIRKRKKCQAESLPKLDTGTKEVKNQKNSHLVAGLALFLSCDFLPLSSLLRCWPLAYCTTNRLAPTLRRGGALPPRRVRSYEAAPPPRRGSGTASSIDRQTPLWTSLCLRLEPLQLLYAIECLCINQRWQRFRGAAAALPAVVLWHSAVLAMRSGVMVLSMCTNLVLQVVNHGETIGRFQGEHTSLVCSVKTGK